MSQETVQKWLKRKKGTKKQKGKPFPVTAKKPKTRKSRADKASPSTRGRNAIVHFNLNEVEIDAAVKWETEKVDPMVRIGYFVGNKQVQKRYEGPKKTVVWKDSSGKTYNKAEAKQKQVMPDGGLLDITPIRQTKKIFTEPVRKEVMDDFLPEAYLEIWADKARDQQDLQQMALELLKEGKVAAVKKFVRSAGTKVYVGFIYPVLNRETDEFSMEMMISQNKRKRRR